MSDHKINLDQTIEVSFSMRHGFKQVSRGAHGPPIIVVMVGYAQLAVILVEYRTDLRKQRCEHRLARKAMRLTINRALEWNH